MQHPFIVGIAGGTGSGKTALTQALLSRFAGRVAVVYHDNYYKRHDALEYDERARLNYDAPEAFDNELMIEHLNLLIDGHAIDSPVYDYADHNRSAQTVHVEPAPLVLVEGILLLHDPAVRGLCDIKIFVDTDADVRILRRVKRDVIERGRSIESVEAQYLATVKPMHELYVEPSKRHADIIVPEGGRNTVAIDVIAHRIEHELDV